jgi:hypothetical protein
MKTWAPLVREAEAQKGRMKGLAEKILKCAVLAQKLSDINKPLKLPFTRSFQRTTISPGDDSDSAPLPGEGAIHPGAWSLAPT